MKSRITYYFFTASKPDASEPGVREWWIEVRRKSEILMLLGPFATLQGARHEIIERPVEVSVGG